MKINQKKVAKPQIAKSKSNVPQEVWWSCSPPLWAEEELEIEEDSDTRVDLKFRMNYVDIDIEIEKEGMEEIITVAGAMIGHHNSIEETVNRAQFICDLVNLTLKYDLGPGEIEDIIVIHNENLQPRTP